MATSLFPLPCNTASPRCLFHSHKVAPAVTTVSVASILPNTADLLLGANTADDLRLPFWFSGWVYLVWAVGSSSHRELTSFAHFCFSAFLHTLHSQILHIYPATTSTCKRPFSTLAFHCQSTYPPTTSLLNDLPFSRCSSTLHSRVRDPGFFSSSCELTFLGTLLSKNGCRRRSHTHSGGDTALAASNINITTNVANILAKAFDGKDTGLVQRRRK